MPNAASSLVLVALLAKESNGLADRLLWRRGQEARLCPDIIRPAADRTDELCPARFDAPD
jgi:hypothetical protein